MLSSVHLRPLWDRRESEEMSTSGLLRTAGLRRTKAREVVLGLLFQAGRPLSHQELASRPDTERFDRVTVYRTLTVLERAGLVHRVQGVDGVWRFRAHSTEPGRCPGNHCHFLCLSCNAMSCLADQTLPWVCVPDGAQVTGKQLVVYGLCPACASESENRPSARQARGSSQEEPRGASSRRAGSRQ